MNELAVPDYAMLLSQTQPSVVHDEGQNELYISRMEELAFKEHPSKAEQQLIELLRLLIEDFEAKTYEIGPASPIEVLSELMEAHEMKQKDLVEQGIFETASVVSEVLSGKRELTKDHIKRLSKYFNVSPSAFFDLA
ncbi:MAG TPA: helix-turn-helix domain-containing protein [Candidatus Saccharimonadales bacterium]|jgi:HTH-type transcriptional regulator/antitoxin HigA|nr:helix-turn-helix domain-containing protein [Candidatus Saccharimonadales bacterium]